MEIVRNKLKGKTKVQNSMYNAIEILFFLKKVCMYNREMLILVIFEM